MTSDKNIIVGAGFSGATIANLIATKLNEQVIVIDKKGHIAGNCFDYFDENGICIHKYGSHIFHTNSEKVWNYVNQFTHFNQYEHKVLANIDGKEVNIPFNFNTLYDVFPENFAKKLEQKLLNFFQINTKVPILEFKRQADEDLKFLAEYIYEKVFLHYTTKQWGVSPDQINEAVTARVPVYIGKDNRYFQDKYQGIPINGYTDIVEKMLNHSNIEVKLDTEFDINNAQAKRIFYTGSIDELFNYKYGILPYRSVYFETELLAQEFYQQNAVINYPSANFKFTRIHEYKYYLNNKSEKTFVAKEFSEAFELGKNERYYPINKEENLTLYEKYIEEAKKIPNLYLLGRLGDYKYYDMDKAILRAIELFEELAK